MTERPPGTRPAGQPDRDRWLLVIAAAFVLFQAAVTAFGGYGYFIDEFYYIACARRPAFGYVDHPPLAPLLLAGVRAIAGESLLAIRIPAALCGAVVVWATGRMTREFGGSRWAVLTAAVTVALAPGLLALTGFFSVNAFEIVAWVLCIWSVVHVLRTGTTRGWLLAGLCLGLGFESKHTTVTLGLALVVGLLATRARSSLWNRWALAGVAGAASRAAKRRVAGRARIPVARVLPQCGDAEEPSVAARPHDRRAASLDGAPHVARVARRARVVFLHPRRRPMACDWPRLRHPARDARLSRNRAVRTGCSECIRC